MAQILNEHPSLGLHAAGDGPLRGILNCDSNGWSLNGPGAVLAREANGATNLLPPEAADRHTNVTASKLPLVDPKSMPLQSLQS